MTRREILAEGVELYLGDCREILPMLGKVDHVISDPPYEKEAHRTDRRVMRKDGLVAGPLSFAMIEDRELIARLCVEASAGWLILFCQAEGVAPWRDAIEAAGAKYKAPMIWVKPDGMPQFNGQGPGMGYESMVSAWCGSGHSRWNGGGRHGVFVCPKGNDNGLHETQKPIKLMSDLVFLFTLPGETVLDPFMGSATTGAAAVRAGRRFIGIEKDEQYFETSCRRISDALARPDLFIPSPAPKAKQEAMDL